MIEIDDETVAPRLVISRNAADCLPLELAFQGAVVGQLVFDELADFPLDDIQPVTNAARGAESRLRGVRLLGLLDLYSAAPAEDRQSIVGHAQVSSDATVRPGCSQLTLIELP